MLCQWLESRVEKASERLGYFGLDHGHTHATHPLLGLMCLPPADVEPALRALLGADGYDLEWVEAVGGTRSPLATPLWDAIASFVAAEEPEALVAPVVSPGFTDSHFLREAFGTVAYGFFLVGTLAARA